MIKAYKSAVVCLSIILFGCSAEQQSSLTKPPGADYEGKAFTIEEVKSGIYYIKGTGNLAVGCNTTLIVNERDAVLVDSHISPAAIWALLNEIKTVTDKPIKYVINTHWHFDHAHGNELFPEDVKIIGHTITRDKMAAGDSKRGRSYESFIGTLPDQIAALEARLAEAPDDSTRAVLQNRSAYLKNYKTATDAVTPRPPNEVFTEKLQYKFGERLIQILHLGRAHTAGDVVVYLPGDKVLITGDLLTSGISYLGDAYPQEWVKTLDKVKELDFDLIMPGHGNPFADREKIDHYQTYLTDFWAKAVKMRKDGVEAERAAEMIDMTNHAANYPNITQPGVSLHGVQRAYELIDGVAE